MIIHKTVPMQVWTDIDEGIAEVVKYLNTIPGIRTYASCQGTIGEGGPHPYRPYVMISWDIEETFKRIELEFDIPNQANFPDQSESLGDHWCCIHPREGQRYG